MGSYILDLGVVGHRHQDVRDILQVYGSGGAPVWIVYVGHDNAHWQEFGRLSPLCGPPYDR